MERFVELSGLTDLLAVRLRDRSWARGCWRLVSLGLFAALVAAPLRGETEKAPARPRFRVLKVYGKETLTIAEGAAAGLTLESTAAVICGSLRCGKAKVKQFEESGTTFEIVKRAGTWDGTKVSFIEIDAPGSSAPALSSAAAPPAADDWLPGGEETISLGGRESLAIVDRKESLASTSNPTPAATRSVPPPDLPKSPETQRKTAPPETETLPPRVVVEIPEPQPKSVELPAGLIGSNVASPSSVVSPPAGTSAETPEAPKGVRPRLDRKKGTLAYHEQEGAPVFRVKLEDSDARIDKSGLALVRVFYPDGELGEYLFPYREYREGPLTLPTESEHRGGEKRDLSLECSNKLGHSPCEIELSIFRSADRDRLPAAVIERP